MTSCFSFDFRGRTHSLDLAQAKQHQSLARLSRLFRSKSDSSVKKLEEASSPSKCVAAPPRRRLMRVVRDAQSEGLEYESQHVIRKYTAGFWEQSNSDREASSSDVDIASRPLPYVVSGHTILKKHGSVDSTSEDSPPCSARNKHTSFNEEVTIMEYDKKGKIKTGQWAKLLQRLNDTDDECDSDSDLSQGGDSGASLSTLDSSQSLENAFFPCRRLTVDCRCNGLCDPLLEEDDVDNDSEPSSPLEVKWTLDDESESAVVESAPAPVENRTSSVDSDTEQPPKKSSKLDDVACNCTTDDATGVTLPSSPKLSASPKLSLSPKLSPKRLWMKAADSDSDMTIVDQMFQTRINAEANIKKMQRLQHES